MPKTKICYNKRSLKAAAAYIWNNNKSVYDWPEHPTSIDEVRTIIKNHMYRVAMENAAVIQHSKLTDTDAVGWVTWAGTGGYMFIFTTDDDITIDVEILVSPTFDYKFVTKTLKRD